MNLFPFMKRKHSAPLRGVARRHRPEIESLEERCLMAANLYVDFGFAFAGGNLNVTDAQMADKGVNGVRGEFGNGYNLISLTRSIQNQHIDLNGDGRFDIADANLLATKVIAAVQRSYAPFDVNVIAVSAANINDIKNSLAQRNTHDAYVLVAGDLPKSYLTAILPSPAVGLGEEDVGNSRDNLAVVFGDKVLRLTTAAQRVNCLAGVVAHEAGHTFGMHHSDPNQPLVPGDVMSANNFPDTQSVFTRFPMPREPDSGLLSALNLVQNSYDLIGANVGFKPGAPAYVTGTGLNDRISISPLIGNIAEVNVYAYSNISRTVLVSSYRYNISLAYGVQVEAGFGNDQIVLDARLNATVDVRGGAGTDEVVVNAAAGPTVVTVNGDNVTVGSTRILANTFGECSGLQINGNSLTTVNVQSTSSGLHVKVAGAGAVNIGLSGSLNSVLGNIASDIIISNPTGKTALNVDDSKDTSFRGQVKVAAPVLSTGLLSDGSIFSSITGLAPGVIRWTPSQVSGVTLQTGTGGAIVNVTGTDGGALSLYGNALNTTVNVGDSGKVSGILSELRIQNTPSYTTVNIDASKDTTARTITFDADRITGLAPAAIIFNALDLQALNVKAGSGGNAIYVNTTPSHGLTTLDTGTGNDAVYVRATRAALTVNGNGGNDTATVGNLGTVANIKGEVVLNGPQTIVIDDVSDKVVRSVVLDSWFGRYDSITGLAPARISYRPASDQGVVFAGYEADGATDVTILAGPGVAGFTIASNHVPLTLYTQGYPGINVGHDGTAQDVVAPVKIQSLSGYNTLVIDDSADSDARTVTVDTFTNDDGLLWGRINGLTPGQITYNSEATAYTGGTPSVTLRMGTSGGEVDLLSAKGSTFGLVLRGDTVIRLGNQGTVDDFRSNLSVTSLGGMADIYIDDSLNAAAKTITLAATTPSLWSYTLPYLSLRGLTPWSFTFNTSAVRYLELSAGMGGNTFTISGQTPFLSKIYTGAGDDTVTLQGNVSGVSVDGQDGVNTLYGPNSTPVGWDENVWTIDGANSGFLNNYNVVFSNVNIVGGAAADHFVMYDSLGLAGPADGGGGVNTLDFSYWSSNVYVNLQTGVASGFPGGIANIQNVTGGAGTNLFVGNGGNVLTGGTGRNILLAGGSSTLIGGAGDNVLIGGTTAYDTDDATLATMAAIWADPDMDFDTRLAALPELDAATVTPSAAGSVLFANMGRDAVFARMDVDIVANLDVDDVLMAI